MTLYLYGASGDVRAELGNPDEVEYSASDIERARTRATNLVNAYMSQVYPENTPFTSDTVPDLLKTVTDDLSVYYCKRAKHKGINPLADDIKTEYYDKSIALLELLAKGELTIPELEESAEDKIVAPRSSYVPVFDIDEIENADIDPDFERDE